MVVATSVRVADGLSGFRIEGRESRTHSINAKWLSKVDLHFNSLTAIYKYQGYFRRISILHGQDRLCV